MATATRIGSPFRYREWGVTVDNMTAPVELILLHYSADATVRQFDGYDREQRIAFPADVRTTLIELGLTEGEANSLANGLKLKLISPKAADAEPGYRPVR
jgi:hypothetical protein